MNMYLDQVSGIGSRYTLCKQECFSGNPQLQKQVEDNAEKPSSMFDPVSTDPCMKDCRAKFYHIFRNLNRYFADDKGFYVEH